MHTRPEVDPALLEHDAANKVRARVFPILPRERKEIIVSFSQELGRDPYRLPLQGLSTVESFDARVVVKTHDGSEDRSSLSGSHSAQRVVELQRSHFTPDKDLVVELDGAAEAAGLHAGRLAVVRVRPHADRPMARPESLLVLFDTSASTHLGFQERVENFGRTIEAMVADGDFRLRVVSFDQERRTIFTGQASALGVEGYAGDSTVAIAAAVALFVLPRGRGDGERLVDWETAAKIPWGVFVMIGGGICIGRAFGASHLDAELGRALGLLAAWSPWVVVPLVCLAATFATEVTSNTAVANVLMPILAAAGTMGGIDPLWLMMPAVLGVNHAFMLPVATAPNAIAFGTGEVCGRTMMRHGLAADLFGIAVITVVCWFVLG